MNPNENSSSSSDDFFDDYVNNMIAMNECLMKKKTSLSSKLLNWLLPQPRLMNGYFIDRPLYLESVFQRRFRMRRPLFLRVVEVVTAKQHRYFQQRRDATGKLGATPIQKCTAALRMLAYETSADSIDEYIKIAQSTVRESLTHFVRGVREVFTKEYLRRPTVTDLQRLLSDRERRGFPGMMGSIDCMHWQWKNYPRAWKGLYQGRSKSATVILEAVASGDLWIWHTFFGTPGTCNDINVLQQSPIFDDLYQGKSPEMNFTVNGNTYTKGYYLTDGIYPKWSVFIPAIRFPMNLVDELFTQWYESVRKDVERAFGILQSRFTIIQRPALVWDEHLLWEIMLA